MHPVLFNLGPLPVYSYGLLVALAFFAGILLTIHYAKKEGIKGETIIDMALYVIIGGVVGARLTYVFGQWDYYRDNLLEIVMLQKGGLVFLGGFIVSFALVVIFARAWKVPLLKLLDAIAPTVALGYSIGRLGCFMNGCCFGHPTTLPWGVVFPPGSLADFYYHGIALHPTQLYASGLMFLAFLALVYLYRKKSYDGQILFWWFVFYSLYRLIVEFFRYSPIYWLGLTPSQWVVIIFLITAASIYLIRRSR